MVPQFRKLVTKHDQSALYSIHHQEPFEMTQSILKDLTLQQFYSMFHKNDSKWLKSDTTWLTVWQWLWLTLNDSEWRFDVLQHIPWIKTLNDSAWLRVWQMTLIDSKWLRVTQSDSRTCCKAQDSGLITHHWYLIRQSPAFPSHFIKSSEKGHQIHTAQSRNPSNKSRIIHRNPLDR